MVPPAQRQLLVHLDTSSNVVQVGYPPDADVMLFQRVTHRHLLGVLRFLREHAGIATVMDIDDDLNSIDPRNPAWAALHPRGDSDHSWHNLLEACRLATMVTVSTPSLAPIYGAHGRVRVLPNYLPDSYYGLPRVDNATIGWPASLHSHPDDPQVTRGAISRLVREGASFRIFGDPEGTGRAFGLEADPPGAGPVALEDWPGAVAKLGVGIAPLNDTKFARSKSWLKPLEMSACGVPWVASPRTEYARLHQMGAGLLADKGKDWYRQLKRLIQSPAMRAEMSEAGRQVADRLRLEDHAAEYAQAWEDALAHQREGKLAAVPT